MKAIAAVLDKKGENAVSKLFPMLKILGCRGADVYCIGTPRDVITGTSLETLLTQEFRGRMALGHVFLRVLATDKPQMANFGNSTFLFDGRIYNPPMECLDAFVANRLQVGACAFAEALIKEFDGCFSFAFIENGKLVAGRDALGLYPLYYGENSDLLAVASERKALWKIGVNEAKPVPPGHILIADEGSVQIRHVKSPVGGVQPRSLEEAADSLQESLLCSTLERTVGVDKVAVAFSGGLDSSLIALLAQRTGVEAHLIHVSLENQPETLQAEEAAYLLDMPFHKFLYSDEDVERVLPEVLWCVESPNPLKASIAIPLFWAAENAAKLGFKVLLSGQGADELFGGYRRYLTLYARFGEEVAQKAITSDILRMHEDNFERDFKVCVFHNVELRLPFVSLPIAEFALTLPLNLKIALEKNALRKLVLRKTAERLGLPRQIVCRPKKAVQYATGVDKALRKLAKKQGFSLQQYLLRIFKAYGDLENKKEGV
ncbi:MAG: asparagine synthetase B [Candidatus Bathyarchaeia archaeon]